MRRTVLRVGVFALTFGLGVFVSACWQLYQGSVLPFEVSSDVAVVERAASAGITIVGAMHACGPKANFHTTELSDGTRISQSCERFSSRAAAGLALKKRLVFAQIAERSPERDEKRRVIGETILTVSPRTMRLNIYGSNLCVLEAPSLKHLRLYETGALHYSLKKHSND